MDADMYKKLDKLLDRTIAITMLLNQRKILNPDICCVYEKCLKGLKRRLADPSYMEQSPVGPDIDQIDRMILTLSEDKLLNAAGKSYVNVLSYSIKTVIYGIGVGHKILTKEEKEQAPYIMVSRRVTVERYLDLLAECERWDQTIEMCSHLKDQIRSLKIQNVNTQKQSEELLYQDPGILKEIELFWDIDEMTENAKSYLSIRSQISKNEKEIAELSMEAERKESTCKLMQERIDSLYREIQSGTQADSICGYVAQIYEEYMEYEDKMKRKREELDAAESQTHS